ncbi:hypothetical protein Pcinc_008971 [Petrolisthes cinctipes]|uniref:Uncharacterized protein n=1 Tax=Petrolisthes cinctipes TaxID=88211 RepID=A0AAE1G5J9_PETCI|nr:hypothetical protein Pcinc_008971 [Petrolisthes cinctipes]
MSKQTSKQEYDHHGRIEEMWRLGQDLGLSSSHIHTVFTAVLAQEEEMETNHQLKEGRGADNRMGATNTRTVVGFNVMTTTQTMLLKAVVVGVKALVCFTLVCFLSCALISLHNPTRKLVTRNIQDLIYPVMTTLRIFTLPVLRRYPHLSQCFFTDASTTEPLFPHTIIQPLAPLHTSSASVHTILISVISFPILQGVEGLCGQALKD